MQHSSPPNKVDALIDYTCIWHTNSQVATSMVRHCVYLRARPPECIFKFGIVLKVLFLDGPLATLDLSSKDLAYIRPTYFGTHLCCPSFGASPVRLH